MPTVTQLIEQEDSGQMHIFESILQILLSYVKFGSIKYGDEPFNDIRIKTVFDLIMDIDTALASNNAKDRLDLVNFIMIKCWDRLEGFLELCKKRYEEATSSSSTETLAPFLHINRLCWI